jgi:hypothetical protein
MESWTLKALAEEYGTDVQSLRDRSNIGPDVPEDQHLTDLQEQNVRNSWEQARNV